MSCSYENQTAVQGLAALKLLPPLPALESAPIYFIANDAKRTSRGPPCIWRTHPLDDLL